jgi:hypothetical protein
MLAEEEKYHHFASRPYVEVYAPDNLGAQLERGQEFEFCGDILEVETVKMQFDHVTLGNAQLLDQ